MATGGVAQQYTDAGFGAAHSMAPRPDGQYCAQLPVPHAYATTQRVQMQNMGAVPAVDSSFEQKKRKLTTVSYIQGPRTVHVPHSMYDQAMQVVAYDTSHTAARSPGPERHVPGDSMALALLGAQTQPCPTMNPNAMHRQCEAMLHLLRDFGTRYTCATRVTGVRWATANPGDPDANQPTINWRRDGVSQVVGSVEQGNLQRRMNELCLECFGMKPRSAKSIKNYLRWSSITGRARVAAPGDPGCHAVSVSEYRETVKGCFKESYDELCSQSWDWYDRAFRSLSRMLAACSTPSLSSRNFLPANASTPNYVAGRTTRLKVGNGPDVTTSPPAVVMQGAPNAKLYAVKAEPCQGAAAGKRTARPPPSPGPDRPARTDDEFKLQLSTQSLMGISPVVFRSAGVPGGDGERPYVGVVAQQMPLELKPFTRQSVNVQLCPSDQATTEVHLLDHRCLQYVLMNSIQDLSMAVKKLQSEQLATQQPTAAAALDINVNPRVLTLNSTSTSSTSGPDTTSTQSTQKRRRLDSPSAKKSGTSEVSDGLERLRHGLLQIRKLSEEGLVDAAEAKRLRHELIEERRQDALNQLTARKKAESGKSEREAQGALDVLAVLAEKEQSGSDEEQEQKPPKES